MADSFSPVFYLCKAGMPCAGQLGANNNHHATMLHGMEEGAGTGYPTAVHALWVRCGCMLLEFCWAAATAVACCSQNAWAGDPWVSSFRDGRCMHVGGPHCFAVRVALGVHGKQDCAALLVLKAWLWEVRPCVVARVGRGVGMPGIGLW